MHKTLTSKVEVLRYDRKILSGPDESDFALVETRLEERFSGGMAGLGKATHLRIEHSNGAGELLCFKTFAGSVDGRPGTFVLRGSGSTDAAHIVRGQWEVVEGSGTNELRGLRGTAVFSAHPTEASDSGWSADTTFTYWLTVDSPAGQNQHRPD